MCGIAAYIGEQTAAPLLYDSLRKLEYRGYDSAGVATADTELALAKTTGEVHNLETENVETLPGTVGIAHTRWATHGGVTQMNAHPHTDTENRFALVHNGIIENHETLEAAIAADPVSETDSEIIVHYIAERVRNNTPVEDAVQQFMQEAEGTFAIVLLDSETNTLYAAKRDSPLALGITEDAYFIGSDIFAFSTHTNQAAFFEDNEIAVITPDDARFTDMQGEPVEKTVDTFTWEFDVSEQEDWDHYMIKEIHEAPHTGKRLRESLQTTQADTLTALKQEIIDHDRVVFVAAGTSYHAALLGVHFLQKVGVDAQTVIASEALNYLSLDPDTLVVAVSQSGETMDVLEAVKAAKKKGADAASLVNVPHSSIQRESSTALEIMAGQEQCVAATKTFYNQVLSFLALAQEFGYETNLSTITEQTSTVIEENKQPAKKVAEKLASEDDVYVIGRGTTYPISREIALKLKEIPYIHAEGMMGGELKHGTLALIEEGTPVIALAPTRDGAIHSNVSEIEARGGDVTYISPFEDPFTVPEGNPGQFALYSTVIGFLITYYTAKRKNLPIDRPKNLAKCVSVK